MTTQHRSGCPVSLMAWALSGALAAVAAAQAVAAVAVARRDRRVRALDRDLTADVRILQPILSGDPDLQAALEHTVETLPDVAIEWLIDEDDPEAARVTAGIVARHPAAPITVRACPPAPPGVNPKSRKLALATAGARHGSLVIVDDDTRVTRRGIAALVAGLDEAVVTTGLPVYRATHGLPGRAIAAWVNEHAALLYLPLAPFGPRSINGMTYAVDAATLARMGGFAAIERSLTDDLAFARLARRHGRIRQLAAPQYVASTITGWRHHASVMHRWMLFSSIAVREQSVGWRTLLLAGWGVPPVLLGALGALAIARPRAAAVPLAAAFAARGTAAAAARLAVAPAAERRRLRAGPIDPVAASLVTIAMPIHALRAVLDPRIRWRSRTYRVRADDDFVPVDARPARPGVGEAR